MYDNNNEYKDVRYSNVENPIEPVVKTHNGAKKTLAFILATAIIGGASGFGGAYLSNSLNSTPALVENVDTQKQTSTSNSNESVTTMPVVENLKSSDTSSSKNTTAQVIDKVTPSVVSISSSFTDGTGTGTGIVMTADGYVITNAHVVEAETYVQSNSNNNNNNPFSGFGNFFGGSNYTTTVEQAKEVIVTLSDGKEHKAKIIGTDSATDLAILKIDASGLTPADFGDSSSLIMGDKAITLGYPLGLGLSASEGIISGLNKEMTIELAGGGTSDMILIQTDAAINPGNSGGPLLNEHGQVVGITSSKLVSSNVEGIGFAIPITDAMPLLQEIIDKGYVANTTPKIGITGTDITSAVQRYYNLPVDKGVLVVSVEKGSAADLAGISEGDVIVGADGKDITTMDELISIKDGHKIGDTMTLSLARNAGNAEVELTLGSQD